MKIFKNKMLGNKKGVTLIMMALMLALLLAFAALAIDIAYMYVVKNELQVAADAAALAGAGAGLSGTDNSTAALVQETARQAAWRFACKNKAAKDPVFLVTSSNNCDSPPSSGLNETNDATGDIVVGNWNLTTRVFTPATGSTGLAINSLKARPRRTGETPGMPSVRLFLGGVLRALPEGAGDWRFMSARAEAIAIGGAGGATANISVCLSPCPPGCAYPTICEISPRVLDTGPGADHINKFAWTSFLDDPTAPGYNLSRIICDGPANTQVCNQEIYTTMGAAGAVLKDLESVMYNPNYDSVNKERDGLGNVTAWWVTIPITQTCPPGAQGRWDPNFVVGYARVRIIAVCATGAAGCGGFNRCSNYPNPNPPPPNVNNVIVIDRISCITCGQQSPFTGITKLVK